jgi:hypothetical protein
MTCRILLIAALAALAAFASAASAQSSARTLTCAFDHRCAAERGCGATKLSMIFHYDAAAGAAFVTGNNGVAEVQAHRAIAATSFVESLPTGSVQVTVIDRASLRAAHRRNHVRLEGGITSSQYYGACTAGDAK